MVRHCVMSAGRRSTRGSIDDREQSRDGRCGRTAQRQGGAWHAHPRRGGRQPEPVGGERRPALDRCVVRRVADGPRPRGRRLLARSRGIRPLVRRPGRPIRTQADDRPGHAHHDPGVHRRRVRAIHRDPVRGTRGRRSLRRHGLPDDPGAHHGAVVGTGPHPLDRDVVRARRRRRDAGPAHLRDAARTLRVGLGVPHHPALRGPRPVHGPEARAGTCERVHGAGGQHRRHPGRGHDRRPHRRPQLHHGAQPADVRARPVRGSGHRRSCCSSSARSGPRTRSTT